MTEDIIVIGAGPSGATASYLLAKEGFGVVVLERGRVPGSKTLYGGKVHASPLKKVFRVQFNGCPVDRWITRERFTLCSKGRDVTLEYRTIEPVYFTSYLPRLTKWIADMAEGAGAIIATETVAERLLMDKGEVKGVVTEDGEELRSKLVVVAEGANRLLLERSGLVNKPSPRDVALGAKYVVRIGRKAIEERLGLEDGEGVSWIFLGDFMLGSEGGGFLYTFNDTVAVGVVIHEPGRKGVEELLETFRVMEPIANVIEGGELVEYGAHLTVSSTSRYMLEKPYGPSYLIIGDAAGLLANLGFAFRGVDHAIYSGYLAAKAASEALKKDGRLDRYGQMLSSSFVMMNLAGAKKYERLLKDPKIYAGLPSMMNDFLETLLSGEEMPQSIRRALLQSAKKSKLSKLDLLFLMLRVIG